MSSIHNDYKSAKGLQISRSLKFVPKPKQICTAFHQYTSNPLPYKLQQNYNPKHLKMSGTPCPKCGALYGGICGTCGYGNSRQQALPKSIFLNSEASDAKCPSCGAADYHGSCHSCSYNQNHRSAHPSKQDTYVKQMISKSGSLCPSCGADGFRGFCHYCQYGFYREHNHHV